MKRSTLRGILTGVSVLGLVSTAVTAYYCGIKADEILEKDRQENIVVLTGDTSSDYRKLAADYLRKMKITWKCWAVPAVTGTLTLVSIIANNSISSATIASLSGVAATSGALYNKAKKEIKKRGGVDGVKEYFKNAIPEFLTEDNVIHGNDGDELFYDEYLDEFFRSSTNAVNSSINAYIEYFEDHKVATLYDLYKMIGLPYIDPDSDFIGWDAEDYENGLDMDRNIEVIPIEDYNGEIINVISYDYIPSYLEA